MQNFSCPVPSSRRLCLPRFQKVRPQGVREPGRLQPGERPFGANGGGASDARHRALEPRPPRLGRMCAVARGTIAPPGDGGKSQQKKVLDTACKKQRGLLY